MAKKISDEQIKLSIVIDGNPAQKELFDLEKSTRRLNEENKALRLTKKELEKQGKKDTDQYREVTKSIKENSAAITANKTKMAELQKEIGLSGLTMKQLTDKAMHLKMALRNMIPGSEAYNKYKAELKEVSGRIAELNDKGKQARFSIQSLADGFNRYAALGASIIAMATGVVLSLQKMIDFNGKLADAQTNVQKTTGMTRKEVDELSKSFGLLKTRTGRIELLGIAEVGGRLGIAKEEIQDFVRVMDKSAVALGDSFEGGPEVVAEKLGRIKGLYQDLKESNVETAFESVGSALNDLGAAGAASEQNMAEFVTRVGAMPEAIKPTIQEALGLGAAFEESGLRAEVAGNNYSKVISIAARDIGAFAKVLNRPRVELEKLINTNPTEFFFQFSSALKGLDATQLAQVLDYLKLNDNEVKMVLGAASQNVDLFREKIALASGSMAEASSLTTEYELKNNNLAATLERLKKKVFGWFTSDSVVAFLEAAVNGFAKFIGAVEDSEGSMTGLRNTLVFLAKMLAIVGTAIISYTTATKLAALWSKNLGSATAWSNIIFKVQYGLMVAQEVATKALALAKALLTGNITRARVAYQALSVAMGMNPFGALLAVIGACITAYAMFASEADKVARKQKVMSEINNEVANSIKQEEDRLNLLLKIAKDETATKEARIRAIKEINRISPEHLGNITLENIHTTATDNATKNYIKTLKESAKAKFTAAKLSELYTDLLEIENSSLEDNIKWYEQLWNTVKSGGNMSQKAIYDMKTSLSNRNEAKKEIQDAIDALLKEQEEEFKKNPAAIDVTSETNVPDITIPDGEADKAAEKAREQFKKDREKDRQDLVKYQQEVNDLHRKAIDERLALMDEGFDKEAAIEAENHRRKIEDLKKQLVAESEINSLDDQIDSNKYSPREKATLKHIKETWLEKNRHLNQLIEIEEGRHELAIETIDLKADTKRIEDMVEANDTQTMLRRAAHNEELAALGNNEGAKQALQKQFDADELERQKAFLEQLLAEKQAIMEDKNSSIDWDLLTPEQRAEIERQAAELKLKISELLQAKSDLQGGSGANDFATAAQSAFGDADILGFSATQWETTFAHLDTLEQKLQGLNMVVGGLQNIWSSYNDFVAAGENRQIANMEKTSDSRRRKLKWELDNGYINQAQYRKRLEVLDAELEKKKAEFEYKQAKRQKTMAIVDATINTAKGVTAAIPNLFLMGLAAAAGALQIATIARQPLPAKGYEEGLYPEYVKREQDGKIFSSRYGGKTRSGLVNRPTHFLTGENGPEMIIDAKAYRQMSPATKQLLINELRGIKGFEQGYYNNDVKGGRIEVPAKSSGPSNTSSSPVDLDVALRIIAANTAIMEKIHAEGITAYWNRDYRDLRKFKEDMDRMNNARNKAQQ